jgi:gamma-glutamylcyclotransferase (GGCT)/AIG2-like uncharacterized protein YtfP
VSEALFSYGTLQDEKVQRAVFGRAVTSEPDAIVGYKLVPVKIESQEAVAISGIAVHTILEPAGRDAAPIEGVLLSITPAELARADAYESAEYKRIRVSLRSGAQAWVYVRA